MTLGRAPGHLLALLCRPPLCPAGQTTRQRGQCLRSSYHSNACRRGSALRQGLLGPRTRPLRVEPKSTRLTNLCWSAKVATAGLSGACHSAPFPVTSSARSLPSTSRTELASAVSDVTVLKEPTAMRIFEIDGSAGRVGVDHSCGLPSQSSCHELVHNIVWLGGPRSVRVLGDLLCPPDGFNCPQVGQRGSAFCHLGGPCPPLRVCDSSCAEASASSASAKAKEAT